MKDDVKIAVVSYKRPSNNTCKLLLETNLNWNVFVYQFDPYLFDYVNTYGEHVHIIPEEKIEKANLSNKRQYVLDKLYEEGYRYGFMFDDDIETLTYNNIDCSIEFMCKKLYDTMVKKNKYVAISASYNKSDNSYILEEYKNICNNTIFDLKLFHESGVKYNPESKCEDMELAIDLFKKGYVSARHNQIIAHNILQGGSTGDGLSYRFNNTNRFIEEGSYMANRYPELKDVFEFDENHFKMNTKTLKNCLQIK